MRPTSREDDGTYSWNHAPTRTWLGLPLAPASSSFFGFVGDFLGLGRQFGQTFLAANPRLEALLVSSGFGHRERLVLAGSHHWY